eukprot:34298-Chlamydomonas_euryale.AAC.1
MQCPAMRSGGSAGWGMREMRIRRPPLTCFAQGVRTSSVRCVAWAAGAAVDCRRQRGCGNG